MCIKRNVKFFQDYIDSLINAFPGKFELVTYQTNDTVPFKPTIHYIFCQTVPSTVMANADKLKFSMINTEQLTRTHAHDYTQYVISKGISVIDYDYYQSRLLSADNHYYLPYQFTSEQDRLINMTRDNDKIYQVAMCGAASPRRKHVINELVKRGISVAIIPGWKDARDKEIAKAKVLLNIHYNENYRVFEHLRCDRWVFTDVLVVSETSISDDHLDISDLIIQADYSKIIDVVVDLIRNYPTAVELHNTKVNKLRPIITENRKKAAEFVLSKID